MSQGKAYKGHMFGACTSVLFSFAFALFNVVIPLTAQAESYVYDSLGRVVQVYTDDFRLIKYKYDAAGNRTEVSVVANSTTLVAVSDAVSTYSNTAITSDPRLNDTYPQVLQLSITAVGTPGHGTVTKTASSVTYTPASNYVGADSFTYTVQTPAGGSAVGTVSVTVLAKTPVANTDTTTTNFNTAKTFNPLSNDTDPQAQTLSVSSVGTAAHGVTTKTATSVTYTPSAGFYGGDSFTYVASNTSGKTATGIVNITVNKPVPVASADNYTTAYDASLLFDPRLNDTDPQGLPLSIYLVGAPSHGTATKTERSIIYKPTAGYVGADSFTYSVRNSAGLTATGTISMTVSPAVAPTAQPVAITTAYNHSATAGLAPVGNFTSLSIVTAPSHGTVTLSGIYATYTPVTNYIGADSFTYRATGPGGASAPATVSVDVTNLPVATVNDFYWYSDTVLPGGTVKSGSTVVSVAGGSGGNVYQWEYVSGAVGISAMNATSATTNWKDQDLINNGGGAEYAIWRCKVTDSAGHVTYSPEVTISISYVDNR